MDAHTSSTYVLTGLESQQSFGRLSAVKSVESQQGLKITLPDGTETGTIHTAEPVSESENEYVICFKDYSLKGKKGLRLIIPKGIGHCRYELGLDNPQNPKYSGVFVPLASQGCGLETLLRDCLKSA